MARHTAATVAALCLAAGMVASVAFLAPTGSVKNPSFRGNHANAAATTSLVDQEVALNQTDGESWAGLWLGCALGMLIGLTAAVKPVSAIDLKAIQQEGRITRGSWDASPQAFDMNLSRKLGQDIVKDFDVEGKFNGEEVTFKVDQSQVPKITYGKVTLNKNDPAIRIGDNDQAAKGPTFLDDAAESAKNFFGGGFMTKATFQEDEKTGLTEGAPVPDSTVNKLSRQI